MKLLLGSIAEVVQSKNKSHIGISGFVVHESQVKNNDAIILYTKDNQFKLVSNCLIKVDQKYIWTPSREIRLIKKIKLKLSTL